VRLNRLRAAEAFPAAASALFTAVQGVEGMELQSLLYNEDGSLGATVLHPNYSDVEVLKAALARSNLLVEEKSAVDDEGRVLSDIAIRRRP
jgi:type II secretory pathway component PulL